MKKLPADQQVGFLRELVERNVRDIAEYSDEITITVDRPNVERVVITVHVDPRDFGLVLGDKGATLNAVRRLAWVACKKTHLQCDVDLLQIRPSASRAG